MNEMTTIFGALVLAFVMLAGVPIVIGLIQEDPAVSERHIVGLLIAFVVIVGFLWIKYL